jgi:hypothetical protein
MQMAQFIVCQLVGSLSLLSVCSFNQCIYSIICICLEEDQSVAHPPVTPAICMSNSRARERSASAVLVVVLLALILLTLALPAVFFGRARLRAACEHDVAANQHVELASAIIRSASVRDYHMHTNEHKLSHSVLSARADVRRAGAQFRAAHHASCSGVVAANRPHLRLSDGTRDALEFGHIARYPVDGVLMYIMALLGTRSRRVIELDGARGDGVFRGAAALALYDGWNALTIYGLWSGYNAAQRYYESSERDSVSVWYKKHFPNSRISVAEAELSTASSAHEAISKHGIGGEVDVVFLLLDGPEWHVWETLTGISPRVVVLFYQDYWGADEMLVRRWNQSDATALVGESDNTDKGRRRLFVGASIRALEHLATKRGFRLVWCLRIAPIAIFIRNDQDSAASLLPAMSTRRCLERRESTTWRRDMEGQWNSAQRFPWDQISP